MPRIIGRHYGERETLISLAPSKEYVRIFVIMGKPNSIIGLDDGIFRSVHKYDKNYINVMSEARFKELSLQSENLGVLLVVLILLYAPFGRSFA